MLRQPLRGLAAFLRFAGFFFGVTRFGQRITPIIHADFCRFLSLGTRGAENAGQGINRAVGLGFGAVGAETFKRFFVLRLLHHLIHPIHDGGRIAACVVAVEQIALQTRLHKRLRGFEHLRFSTAETVNALLGVAHKEHANRLASARITRQPRIERLPLQRIGILKFVNQQVANLGIQTLLHPAA